MGLGFYIYMRSTLSTAAATMLAEPSTSDDRFPGVHLKHTTDHLRSLTLKSKAWGYAWTLSLSLSSVNCRRLQL